MEDRGAVEEHAEPRGAVKEPSIATLVTVRKNWQVAGSEAVVQPCKMERQLNKEGGISGLEAGLALLGVVIALKACLQAICITQRKISGGDRVFVGVGKWAGGGRRDKEARRNTRRRRKERENPKTATKSHLGRWKKMEETG